MSWSSEGYFLNYGEWIKKNTAGSIYNCTAKDADVTTRQALIALLSNNVSSYRGASETEIGIRAP
jgi:hypothetical protein